MIFADERVPDGFARSAHAHRKRQHGKFDAASGEFRKQQLVATYPREVVDVAGFGHPDRRMDKQVGFDLFGGAEGQLHVGAMHWVTSLKGDHAAPTQPGKLSTQFGRGKTQSAEVVM